MDFLCGFLFFYTVNLLMKMLFTDCVNKPAGTTCENEIKQTVHIHSRVQYVNGTLWQLI